MAKIGDLLYGMRIVKTYNGQFYEERPLFNGFEGIVEWLTQYINQQIDKAMQPIKAQYNNILPIAIDETMANIIQRHDEK